MTSVIRKKRLEATRNASFRSPFSSSSLNTGTNAPWRAESANSARTRFGTWNAIVNADMAAVTPKYLAATTSRARPSRRDSPVAKLKKAVLRATRRAWPGRSGASVAIGWRPLHSRRSHGRTSLHKKSGFIGRSASASRTGAALRR